MEKDFSKLMEYMKNALPRLTYSEQFGSWYLEFEATYGDTFEADSLDEMAEELHFWIHSEGI